MENETRKFSTLQELLDALYYDTVSAEIISEKRACFKDGTSYECCNFEIPEVSEQHFWNEIAKVIWSKPTEANINDLKIIQRLVAPSPHMERRALRVCRRSGLPL